jgi:hypothetical protein
MSVCVKEYYFFSVLIFVVESADQCAIGSTILLRKGVQGDIYKLFVSSGINLVSAPPSPVVVL